MVKLHEKLKVIYPESYGAKALQDPRGGDYELAKKNSCAFKSMFHGIRGPKTYAGGKYTIPTQLTGWYPICEELHVRGNCLKMTGKGATYEGCGLKWIGPTKPGESMIHLSESDSSIIERVGFIGQRTDDPDKRMLAPIRTSFDPQISTQSGITIRGVIVGDTSGRHGQVQHGTDASFEAGIVSGGPGSGNGNDDFFIIDNCQFADCVSGIRVDHNQAVQWSIDNFRTVRCDHMYQSLRGGSFLGRNWYPDHQCKTVIRCDGPRHENLHIDLQGFSSEHMKSEALIDVSSSISGRIQGYFIQPSALNEPREFYWLRMRDHAGCRLVFQDFYARPSQAYGSAPLEQMIQLANQAGGVEYKLTFQNCQDIGGLRIMQNPGWAARKINLLVDEKRRLIEEVYRLNPTLIELGMM